MKPCVINQDQIKQYVFAAVAALVLAFLAGYLMGLYQHQLLDHSVNTSSTDAAEVQNPEENPDATPEVKSEQPLAATASTKPTAAQLKLEQENLENEKLEQAKLEKEKQEKAKLAQQKLQQQKKEQAKKRAEQKRQQALKEKQLAAKRLAEKQKAEELAARKLAEQQQQQASSGIAAPGATTTNTAVTTDNQRFYAVQVGMFSSKGNAQNFVEKLSEKKFEAHVSDFVSSSGSTKYNVRIGRFQERDEARALLREFQNFFTTPAYVVIAQ